MSQRIPAIFIKMLFLIGTAVLVVFLLAGAAGAQAIGDSAVPLVTALQDSGSQTLATVVNVLGLVGLIASFFSIIYGYSRLVFALSRAGYLPKVLSLTSRRKAPTWALVVPGVFGFLVSLSGEGDLILGMAVVGATLSYALMALSHILLRLKRPEMPRPYRTPGGIITSWSQPRRPATCARAPVSRSNCMRSWNALIVPSPGWIALSDIARRSGRG